MSISADSPSDETLNRGPLALLLRRQYEFPFGISIVQFSFFFHFQCILDVSLDVGSLNQCLVYLVNFIKLTNIQNSLMQ